MSEPTPVWIRQLHEAASRLQEIPLWGRAPAFPWEKAAEDLKETLHTKSLRLLPQESRFLKPDQQLSTLGENPLIISLSLMPFSGAAFFAIPRPEMEKLAGTLLTTEVTSKGFTGEEWNEGFVRFVFLNALKRLNETNTFGDDFTAMIAPPQELPGEGSLSLDLTIEIGSQKVWTRFICSDTLLNEIQSHYQANPSTSHLPANLLLPLHVDIGSTTLKTSQWKKVKVGDLLVLDRCSYDLDHHKGTGTLATGGHPLFEVRIKDSEIKVLEHAFYQEEAPMAYRDNDDEEEIHTPSGETEDEEEPLWSTESSEEEPQHLLPSRDIPLTLTVEVARKTMPLEKVAELRPGNLLDLQITPPLIVSLTVSGQRIAKGELVKIGESIGVKILALHE